MQDTDIQNTVDWIVTALRWLTLLGLVVSLAAAGQISLPMIALLILAGLWNTNLTVMAGLDHRFTGQQAWITVGDALVAYLLFYFSGLLDGPLVWAGLLPLIPASLYFPYRGALAVTLLNGLVQGGLTLLDSGQAAALGLTGGVVALYLTVGLALSFLRTRMGVVARELREITRKREQEQVIVRAEQDRKRSIYHLVSALSSTLNYQRVLAKALDVSAEALFGSNGASDTMASAVLLFHENGGQRTELVIGSARGFTPADMRSAVPGREGLLGAAIEEGQTCLTQNLARDPELSRFLALGACRSACCIPLRAGLDAYGVLLFAHPDPAFFTPERREVLDIVGSQATIAIQNARLYEDLEREKERMIELQEEARKNLARDLHDGPTQSIAAIAMRVNFARRLVEADPAATAEELQKIEDLARRTTREIRHMLFTLRPLVLESQGLAAALGSMADKMHDTYGQHVHIQAEQTVITRLEIGKQAILFQVAEEAANNARKHAHADNIWVRLRPLQDELALLEIEDDGVGFDVGAVDASYENRGSLGMLNIRERAELVNGILHIESLPDRGTKVQMVFPLSDEAAERLRSGA